MKRIFISYSRLDRDFATRLAKSLAEVGADVWIDYEDIPAGLKWSSAIQEGLDTSDGLLVIISPEAMVSSNVEDEWQYFLDSKRPVIPILHKPAKIHFQLHRLQYVDFSVTRFGDAFSKLLDELRLKGIPLEVEEAEETAIYDVRRSKPPKRSPDELPDSMKATAPSMKVIQPTEPSIHLKKPVLNKPSLPARESRFSKGMILLAVFLAVFLAIALLYTMNPSFFGGS
jgi:hypothetical protein